MRHDEPREGEGPLISVADERSPTAGDELARSQDLYRELARHLPNVAVFVFDLDLRVLVAEGEALTRHRLRETKLHGRLLEEVLESDSYEALAPAFRAALAGERVEFEYAVPHTGRSFWVSAVPLRDEEGGRIWAGLTLTQDITDLRQTERELIGQTKRAQHDELTGLPNRALFRDRLNHALAQAVRHRRPLAVMFVDLDRFKAFNDMLGHDAGDHVLQAIAKRLQASVREADTVARLAGDEFILLLEGLGRDEDFAVAAERVAACFEQPLSVAGRDLVVSASIGVAIAPADGDSAETLLAAADTAMYRVKTQHASIHRISSRDRA